MASVVLTSFLCVVFLNFTECLPIMIRGRPRGGLLQAPAQHYNGLLPPDEWIEQKLDHFNHADTRTWKQRYFVNSTFHKPGGPVFLMIGGEGTANPIWMVMGHWITLAQKHNALCLMLEHRYYGKSHPTEDLSVPNMAYLSSEQALADLAHFRNYMAGTMNLGKSKWIAFGGSYPGTLAAWYRLKFPHLVDGSVATSAPVFAKLNFEEYFGVVTDVMTQASKPPGACKKATQSATQQIHSMLQTAAGRKQLKQTFRLCDDIDVKNKDDISNLFNNLAGNFANVVQYNKDNRNFEGAKGTNITINTLCDMLAESASANGSIIQQYGKLNSLILDTYGSKCLEFKYDNMIKELQQTSWQSSAGEGGKQWIYQTCTEFGFYQSSDLKDQPFGHDFSVEFSIKQCKDIFGSKFTEQLNQAAINRSNTDYGGFGIKVTNVVFPNGSVDPWHKLGITKDISPDATAIFIQGTAHCANMYPPSTHDSTNLVQARLQIDKLVAQWLQ